MGEVVPQGVVAACLCLTHHRTLPSPLKIFINLLLVLKNLKSPPEGAESNSF